MDKLLELRRERSEAVNEAQAILDGAKDGKLTDEQKTKYDDLVARAKDLKEQEERYIALNDLVIKDGTVIPRDDLKDDPPKDEKRFESLGEQLRAIVAAETNLTQKRDERLIYRQLGMSEGVPQDGGFLIQQDFASELLKNAYETGILGNRCRKQPIGPNSNGFKVNVVDETSRARGSRMGGIRVYWTAEGAVKQGSKPKYRQLELNLQKITGLLYATDELLADAVALEAFIGSAFAEEFGFEIDDAIIRGTGAGMPLGILNSNALVTQAAEAGQAARTVKFENLSKMWARLPARSRRNAIWLINQEVEPQLDTMSIVAGTAALEPRFVTYGPDGVLRIKARPVIAIEQADQLGAVGDIMLVDLNQYLLIDKGPMQSAASIHVRFIEDETTFRFVYRVNGQPIWNQPLTPYKGANTQSPFVALAART